MKTCSQGTCWLQQPTKTVTVRYRNAGRLLIQEVKRDVKKVDLIRGLEARAEIGAILTCQVSVIDASLQVVASLRSVFSSFNSSIQS